MKLLDVNQSINYVVYYILLYISLPHTTSHFPLLVGAFQRI